MNAGPALGHGWTGPGGHFAFGGDGRGEQGHGQDQGHQGHEGAVAPQQRVVGAGKGTSGRGGYRRCHGWASVRSGGGCATSRRRTAAGRRPGRWRWRAAARPSNSRRPVPGWCSRTGGWPAGRRRARRPAGPPPGPAPPPRRAPVGEPAGGRIGGRQALQILVGGETRRRRAGSRRRRRHRGDRGQPRRDQAEGVAVVDPLGGGQHAAEFQVDPSGTGQSGGDDVDEGEGETGARAGVAPAAGAGALQGLEQRFTARLQPAHQPAEERFGGGAVAQYEPQGGHPDLPVPSRLRHLRRLEPETERRDHLVGGAEGGRQLQRRGRRQRDPAHHESVEPEGAAGSEDGAAGTGPLLGGPVHAPQRDEAAGDVDVAEAHLGRCPALLPVDQFGGAGAPPLARRQHVSERQCRRREGGVTPGPGAGRSLLPAGPDRPAAGQVLRRRRLAGAGVGHRPLRKLVGRERRPSAAHGCGEQDAEDAEVEGGRLRAGGDALVVGPGAAEGRGQRQPRGPGHHPPDVGRRITAAGDEGRAGRSRGGAGQEDDATQTEDRRHPEADAAVVGGGPPDQRGWLTHGIHIP